jgi:peptide-methionine (S)-S-oxide reductase
LNGTILLAHVFTAHLGICQGVVVEHFCLTQPCCNVKSLSAVSVLESDKRRFSMKRLALASAAFLMALSLSPTANAAEETAIFAGGCFWCVEKDFDHVKGVVSTTSGYAGGTKKDPAYDNHEGYIEAVKVVFDNSKISYDALTAHFLRTIDVTDAGGQFCDRGYSYIPALFPLDAKQKSAASAALADAGKALGAEIVVKLSDNTSFFDAEDYHQNYYLGENRVLTRFGYIKQSEAYANYREGCGRNARVNQLWRDAAYTFPAGGQENS